LKVGDDSLEMGILMKAGDKNESLLMALTGIIFFSDYLTNASTSGNF
jgi:hypothetical protein